MPINEASSLIYPTVQTSAGPGPQASASNRIAIAWVPPPIGHHVYRCLVVSCYPRVLFKQQGRGNPCVPRALRLTSCWQRPWSCAAGPTRNQVQHTKPATQPLQSTRSTKPTDLSKCTRPVGSHHAGPALVTRSIQLQRDKLPGMRARRPAQGAAVHTHERESNRPPRSHLRSEELYQGLTVALLGATPHTSSVCPPKPLVTVTRVPGECTNCPIGL